MMSILKVSDGSAIPAAPGRGPSPLAREALAAARTYLRNAHRLVYSYGGRTFLSGYRLYDPESGRGFIDCSTLLLLVLAGIPFEESPYGTGTVDGLSLKAAPWGERELADFSRLPSRYVEISERIGRPYLAGPKGLDLARAEDMGISLDTLRSEIRAAGGVRRSARIAQFYLERNGCFSDPAFLRPGDLVFYLSGGVFSEGERKYPTSSEVTHVGIVSEDPARMIESSGSRRGAPESAFPAVSLSPVFGSRTPGFFARPEYRPSADG